MSTPQPLSDRETLLIQYALILGVFGEGSKQDTDFCDKYSSSPEFPTLWSALVEIVLLYRLEKGNK
jgi:hypothetical protein